MAGGSQRYVARVGSSGASTNWIRSSSPAISSTRRIAAVSQITAAMKPVRARPSIEPVHDRHSRGPEELDGAQVEHDPGEAPLEHRVELALQLRRGQDVELAGHGDIRGAVDVAHANLERRIPQARHGVGHGAIIRRRARLVKASRRARERGNV